MDQQEVTSGVRREAVRQLEAGPGPEQGFMFRRIIWVEA